MLRRPAKEARAIGGKVVRTGWMRIDRLVAILFVATMVTAYVIGAPSSNFKLEAQFPNGGTEMHLLTVGKAAMSSHTEVRAGTGPEGPWSEEHVVVTEFKVVSINRHSVDLRFRLKRYDGHLSLEQTSNILEAEKVSWHMIRYIPGKRVSVPMENGQPVELSGSVVPAIY
jgi:hypothetical protein